MTVAHLDNAILLTGEVLSRRIVETPNAIMNTAEASSMTPRPCATCVCHSVFPKVSYLAQR